MEYTLWPACVKVHSFEAQLQAAKAGGFTHLPIGPLTIESLRATGVCAAEVRARAAEYGVSLGHYDGFTDWGPMRFSPDMPEGAKAVFDFSAEQCLDVCEEFGLQAICATGGFAAGQFDTAQLADCFAGFCEQAEARNIRVDLEAIPMWGVPSLRLAWDILRKSGASNAGLLLDTWHFFRGDADLDLLRQLPAGAVTTIQLADAARHPQGADLFEDCIRFRQLPGEGELDIDAVLRIVLAKGGLTSIGPEIFSDALDQMPPLEVGQAVSRACRRAISAAGFDSALEEV